VTDRTDRCLLLVVGKHGKNQCQSERLPGSALCAHHLAEAAREFRALTDNSQARPGVINLDHLAQGRPCCTDAVRELPPGSTTGAYLFKQEQPDDGTRYLIGIRGDRVDRAAEFLPPGHPSAVPVAAICARCGRAGHDPRTCDTNGAH
jgi:hypothetical protein